MFLKIYFRNSTRLGFRWLTKSKETIKGPLLGLRQFLTTESPFKIMKNAFYFTLEALFVLEIFLFLSWLFGYEEKQRDSKTVRNTAWENKVGRLVPDLSLFSKKLYIRKKQVVSALVLIYFGGPRLGHTIKTSYITFQTFDPETCWISVICRRVWDQPLHHILCMIFQKKYFSCYILLTDQISLSGCLYFLRDWVICVFELFLVRPVKS